MATSSSTPDVASPLAALRAAASQYHASQDALVRALLEARTWGGTGGAVGMDVETWLELCERLPRSLVNRVGSVADRLTVMPHCAGVWTAGLITFDELYTLVRGCAEFSGEPLAMLDDELACLAAEMAADDRLADLQWEVDVRAQRLRAPGWAQRQERHARAGNQVTWQTDFDGNGHIHASLDPLRFQLVAGTIEWLTAPATKGVSRRGQRADALVEMAELASGNGQGTKGRPTLNIVIDIERATPDRFAQILTNAGGTAIPTLSARLTECLAQHAKVLIDITRGATPLAELRTKDIPTQIRRTVTARDRGSRWPGDTSAASDCQLHHTNGRAPDGSHPVEQLVLLPMRRHQLTVEKHGWQVDVDPQTAKATFTHDQSGIRLTSMPRGTAPDHDWRTWNGPLPEWLAPPVPPAPTDADAPPEVGQPH